ncbi:MAG: hypothetical protein R2717_06720 [Schumannella sp.]
MSGPSAPETGASRMRRSRLFAIVAFSVAGALLITAGVVAAIRFWPRADSQNLAEQAPSAFGVAIVPLGPPLLTRGDALALRIETESPEPVAHLELWDGDRLYYQVDDPGGSVELDYVPMLAGVHVLTARATVGPDATSLSAPLQLAVDDRPPAAWTVGPDLDPDAGAYLDAVVVHSGPGDTPAIVAERLGVEPGALQLAADEEPGAPPPDEPLEPGTAILSPVISRAAALAMTGFGPTLPHVGIPLLNATVEDCVASVGIENSGKKWALYASTPLRPGLLRVGDVAPGAPLQLGSLPLGPTVLVAYRVGTTPQGLGLDTGPTPPLQVVIPDDCLGRGWTGDASIINGVLVSSVSMEGGYAYVSIDAAPWVRVPGPTTQTLENAQLNDIRAWLDRIRFDRADVEIWRSVDGMAQKLAEGHFCLKDVPGATVADGSGAGSACSPLPAPQNLPGSPGAPVTTLTAQAENAPVNTGPFGTPDPVALVQQQLTEAQDAAASLSYVDDPAVSQRLSLDTDRPVTFSMRVTGAPDTDWFELQFSFFPLSPQSATQHPPGVFASIHVPATKGPDGSLSATRVVHPWLWKDSRPDLTDTSAFDAGGESLSLDDELAYALAQQRLEQGLGLIENVYVRALPVEQLYQAPAVSGPASRNVLVAMPPASSQFTVVSPTLTLEPGLDTTAPDGAYGGRCAAVDAYPAKPAQTAVDGDWTGWGFAWNNYKIAHKLFPDPSAVYCLDPNAPAIREARAKAEAEDCGWGCVLLGVVLGAAIGFAAGGPIGALVGALAGGTLAFAAPGAAKAALKALQEFYDGLVAVYNSAFQAVLTLAAKLNPVCLGAGAIEDAAGGTDAVKDVCESVTKIVVAAAVTYTTGRPTSRPPSSALVDVAEGQLAALIEVGMDAALSKIGLSCDAVRIKGGTATEFIEVGNKTVGNAETSRVLETARTADGGYSLCGAVGNVVASKVRQEIGAYYNATMSQILELRLPDGMIATPVADSPPVLIIRGGSTGGQLFQPGVTVIGQTCPAIVNLTANTPASVPNVAGTPTEPTGSTTCCAASCSGRSPRTWSRRRHTGWSPTPGSRSSRCPCCRGCGTGTATRPPS